MFMLSTNQLFTERIKKYGTPDVKTLRKEVSNNGFAIAFSPNTTTVCLFTCCICSFTYSTKEHLTGKEDITEV